ncbi:hypothetical protein AC1031_006514 [Aphanomyces cochlioides]|nr:hypothetical protein AC1031_006514 [Aphanomyces cochlioides]
MDTPITTPALPEDVVRVVTAVPVVVHADNEKGGKGSPVQAVLIDNLPRLEVDFLVKKAKTIGSDDWVWRQIVLHGQKLEVIHKNTIVETFSTVACELNEAMSATKVYQIVSSGKNALDVLLSKTTEFWTFPPVDVFEDLVGVAKMIVESEDGLKASPVKALVVPASNVTVAQVQAHLASLKAAYDAFPHFGSQEELYQHVLAIEADFVKALEAKQADDYPPIVQQILKLYPEAVGEDGSYTGLTLQLDFTKCPHCLKPFSLKTRINLHVGGKTLVSMPMPDIPRDGKVKSYTDRLWRVVYEYETAKHSVPTKAKFLLEDRIMACLNRLDLVQLIYRQLLFMSQIVVHFDYWNHPTVVQAAIHRYDKFRVLATPPKALALAATLDILLVGQTHQLTSSTAVFPVDKGSNALLSRLGNAAFLWGQTFNEPYSSCALEDNEPLEATSRGGFPRDKWEKFTRLPSRGNRFVGVQEVFAVESLGYNPEFAHEGLATAVSVIGALEVDDRISRGKFRSLLPQDVSRVYMYRYIRDVPTLAEKIILGFGLGVAIS